MFRLLLLVFLFTPLPVMAHNGPHASVDWAHLFHEPDHLLMVFAAIAAGAWLARRYWQRSRHE